MTLIAPSILSADFGRLAEEVTAADEGGADWIHVDVMDGHFVPNISIGPAVTAAVRSATSLPVDVHLMIEDPDRYLEAFIDAGADRLTVHQEACPHVHRTVERIRALGVHPGVAVNPATPVSLLEDIAAYVDLVLIMSVNPGFGGQSFIPGSLGRMRSTRAMLDRLGCRDVHVEVDGGIDEGTAAPAAEAGADVLVAGSAVYRHQHGVAAGIAALRSALEPASGGE